MNGSEVLRKVVGGIFAMELGSWHEWGLSQEWYQRNGYPGQTYFRDRAKRDDAIDDNVVAAVEGLCLASFNRGFAHFRAEPTSRKALAVIRELAYEAAPEGMAVRVPDEGEALASKADALARCIVAILYAAAGRGEYDRATAAGDVAAIVAGTRVGPGDPIGEDSARYLAIFSGRLHMEDERGGDATLADVFVEPPFAMPGHRGVAGPEALGGILELMDAFAAGEASRAVPGLPDGSAVMTVLGVAGVGKTSVVAAALAAAREGLIFRDRRVYCVRASKLAGTAFYESRQPLRFIERNLDVAGARFEGSVVVIDGLDELCLVLSAGESVAGFYERLVDDALSYSDCKLVVTSRPNYVHPDAARAHGGIVVELQPLDDDKARRFVELLEEHSGPGCGGAERWYLDQRIRRRHRGDVFRVPLVLYITVALNIGKTSSEGEFFDRVFAELCSRAYGDGFTQEFAGKFKPRELARAFAVEMRRRSDKALDASTAAGIIERFGAGSLNEDELGKLKRGFGVTFFYAPRTGGPDGCPAPEFMHRSFVDFLAAEQIYLDVSSAVTRAREDDGAARMELWEKLDYLLGWSELGGEVLEFFAYKVRSGGIAGDEIRERLLGWLVETYLPAGLVYRSGRETDENTRDKAGRMMLALWGLLRSSSEGPVMGSLDSRQKSKVLDELQRASGQSMARLDFSGEDLGGVRLAGARFQRASFSRATFAGSVLDECEFAGCIMNRADFGGSHVMSTGFAGSTMAGTSFRGAVLEDVRFGGATMRVVDFSGATLVRVSLAGSLLSEPADLKLDDAVASKIGDVYDARPADPGPRRGDRLVLESRARDPRTLSSPGAPDDADPWRRRRHLARAVFE